MEILRINVKGELGFSLEFGKINIILGDNKTGKSTFVKLLMYALGVRIDSFIDEISKSEQNSQVELDVILKNKKQYRIIRKLPFSKTIIMTPFLNDSLVEEEMEIMSVSEYSDMLLNLEGYKNISISYGTSNKASMRYYFLLRAILVDQETNAHNILADIGGGDKAYLNNQRLIKKAIIEEIIQKDNIEIQNVRFKLQEKTKERTSIASGRKTIEKLIDEEFKKKPELSKMKSKVDVKIKKLDEEKSKLMDSKLEELAKLNQVNIDFDSKYFSKLKKARAITTDEVRNIQLSINDLNNAEKNIKEELDKLKKMIVARQIFTQIPVELCPVCFSELKLEKDKDGLCPFCENIIIDDNLDKILRYKKMLDETLVETKIAEDNLKKDLEAVLQRQKKLDNSLEQKKLDYLESIGEKKQPIEEILFAIKKRIEVITSKQEELRNYKSLQFSKDRMDKEYDTLSNDILKLKEKLNELERLFSTKDLENEKEWKDIFRNMLSYIFGDINSAELDSDYIPIIDGNNVKRISSASLKVAIRLSYILSLFYLKEKKEINHLGFVVFDSPRDKDLDKDKYSKFLKIINQRIKSGQVFLTGSIKDKELYTQIYNEEQIILTLSQESKLLK